MEDKHLDKIIREKLGRLDVPYQPDTWDALAKRMDDADAQIAQEFDEGIREKLNGGEVNFEQGHWNIFEKQLETAAIRKQLYRYKAAELLLLFLIFFTMWQLLPENSGLRTANPPIAAVSNSEILDSEKAVKLQIDTNRQVDDKVDSAVLKESVVEQRRPQIEAKTEEIISVITSIKNDNLKVTSVDILEEQEGELEFEPIEVFERRSEKLITPLNTSIKELSKPIVEVNLPSISTNKSIIIAEHASVPGAGGLVQLDERRVALLEQSTQKLVPAVIMPKSKYTFRLGFASSMNIDDFRTPSDSTLMLEEGEQKWAVGYGGDITIGWKHERVEIETGISYTSKSYSPKQNLIIHGDFQNGYVIENIDRINFSAFELPIQIKYDVIDKGRWTVYPLIGTSLHIVREYITEVQSTDLASLGPASQSPTIGDNSADPQIQKFNAASTLASEAGSPLLSGRSFVGGWNLKEKNFAQNSYVSVNGGLGIEFQASEECSFFAQSIFKYNPSSIGGVGPNRDRIHTTTLTLGIKAKL